MFTKDDVADIVKDAEEEVRTTVEKELENNTLMTGRGLHASASQHDLSHPPGITERSHKSACVKPKNGQV